MTGNQNFFYMFLTKINLFSYLQNLGCLGIIHFILITSFFQRFCFVIFIFIFGGYFNLYCEQFKSNYNKTLCKKNKQVIFIIYIIFFDEIKIFSMNSKKLSKFDPVAKFQLYMIIILILQNNNAIDYKILSLKCLKLIISNQFYNNFVNRKIFQISLIMHCAAWYENSKQIQTQGSNTLVLKCSKFLALEFVWNQAQCVITYLSYTLLIQVTHLC
eukprot:TRINITY_DN15372_c0_g1_i3.p2 TRINITY_DN15372_c0_g1~~TRINITY_DN15372_c0_g1_i3.p2  ORF type:complete len:215 (-),score=-7.24 TRINITY_DN15372_c0_g1_i3:222-866(-)